MTDSYREYIVETLCSRISSIPWRRLNLKVDSKTLKISRSFHGSSVYFSCENKRRWLRTESCESNPQFEMSVLYSRENSCISPVLESIDCELIYSEFAFSISFHYEQFEGRRRWRIEIPISKYFDEESIVVYDVPHDAVQSVLDFIEAAEMVLGVE